MSKVYYKLNEWNESLKICQELVSIENSKINKAELHLQLGLIQFKLGNLDEAEKNISESERLFDASQKKMVLRVHELKALVLRDKKDYQRALLLFEKIKASKEELYGEDNIYVYQTLSNIASIHFNQKEFHKAEIMQQ